MQTARRLVCVAAMLVMMGGCNEIGSGTRVTDRDAEAEVPLGDFDGIYDFVPTADGSLYGKDIDGNLWCIRGAEAVKVQKVEQFSPKQVSHAGVNRTGWLWAMQKRIWEEAANAALDEAADRFEDFEDRDRVYGL